jgi:hypothetical protein
MVKPHWDNKRKRYTPKIPSIRNSRWALSAGPIAYIGKSLLMVPQLLITSTNGASSPKPDTGGPSTAETGHGRPLSGFQSGLGMRDPRVTLSYPFSYLFLYRPTPITLSLSLSRPLLPPQLRPPASRTLLGASPSPTLAPTTTTGSGAAPPSPLMHPPAHRRQIRWRLPLLPFSSRRS